MLDPVPARPISLTSIEKENSSDDIIADDFEGEEEENFQLIEEEEKGKQSIFALFEKELLWFRTIYSLYIFLFGYILTCLLTLCCYIEGKKEKLFIFLNFYPRNRPNCLFWQLFMKKKV